MSQPAPTGRITPRWSTVTVFPLTSVQLDTGTAFAAGLLSRRATVCVGPPLFCKPAGSSPAGTPFVSPTWARKLVQLLSSDKLNPSDTTAPPALMQFADGPLVNSVPFTVNVEFPKIEMPPPLLLLLPVTVL